MDKFLGVGLKNLLGITLFTMLFIVALKTVFAKWEVKGISEVVHSV